MIFSFFLFLIFVPMCSAMNCKSGSCEKPFVPPFEDNLCAQLLMMSAMGVLQNCQPVEFCGHSALQSSGELDKGVWGESHSQDLLKFKTILQPALDKYAQVTTTTKQNSSESTTLLQSQVLVLKGRGFFTCNLCSFET